LAELMPPRWQDDRPPGQWGWIAQARATGAEFDAGPVFTTFDGPEPDVWPVLAQHAPSNAAGMAIVAMAGWLAVVFGLAIWNRNRNRIRLAPHPKFPIWKLA
jgi:hypothetical protein